MSLFNKRERDLGRLEGRVEQALERLDEHARESRDTSQRIEAKVDQIAQDHGGRMANTETRIRRLERSGIVVGCALIGLGAASEAIPAGVVRSLLGLL